MTAKQRAARAKFKAVVKEAQKLRKKNPKLTQAQAVKQAWAISYSKKRAGVGAVKKKAAPKKKAATKVKAKKRAATEMHTDTKSHNVNIRVISGVDEKLQKQITHEVLKRIDDNITEIAQREKVIASVISRKPELVAKYGIRWYKKWINDARKIVSELKTHNREFLKLVQGKIR